MTTETTIQVDQFGCTATNDTKLHFRIGDSPLSPWGLPIQIVKIESNHYIGPGDIRWSEFITPNGEIRVQPMSDANPSGNGSQQSSPITQTATTDMLNAALCYATYGWHVIPLHEPLFDATDSQGKPTTCSCEEWRRYEGNEHNPPNPDHECATPGKHPRIRDWENKATIDQAQIRKWWRLWPQANIGIAPGPSNLVVVDKDTYHQMAGDGTLTLADTNTITSLTGGGGEHLFYEHPEGERITNADANLPEWVNIRGHGGMVVVPPSMHQSGRRYSWEADYGPHEIEPAEMPSALREVLQPPGDVTDGQAGATKKLAPAFEGKIPAGKRHTTLISYAGSMRHRGMSEDEILAALLVANEQRCVPPKTKDEVRKIAEWAARKKPGKRPVAERPSGTASAPTSADYIRELTELGYSFKLNELDDTVEVNGQPMSDVLRAKIFSQMADLGFKGMQRIEYVFTANAYDNRYHPVKDYLNGLRGHDSTGHVDRFLDHLTFAENEKISRTFIRRWMLGAVGKALNQDQNYMLVLEGPQAIGKSRLVRWLCPLPHYFIESAINPDDKDCILRLFRHFIWEVSELQATTRRADREALKNFITLGEGTVRKPYGRHDLTKPALASMIGTINETGSGFLDDRTGSRRFAIVSLKRIEWTYVQNVDINEMWAEIVNNYRAGERGALTLEEKKQQARINSGYASMSTVEEYLWHYYEVDTRSKDWKPVREILSELESNGLTGNQRANMMELGQILKAKEAEGVTKGRPKIDDVKTTCYTGLSKIRKGHT